MPVNQDDLHKAQHDTDEPPSTQIAPAEEVVAATNDKEHQQEHPAADEFGLPVRPPRRRLWTEGKDDGDGEHSQPERDTQSQTEEAAESSSHMSDRNGAPSAVLQHSQTGDGFGLETADSSQTQNGKDEVHDLKKIESAQTSSPERKRQSGMLSEWSHQQLTAQAQPSEDDSEDDLKWQQMPSLATFRQYDDWGKVTAQAYDEVEDDQVFGYSGLGGAGKGYTRVQNDEDAQSATSMDDNTAYLFKPSGDLAQNDVNDDDEEARDLVTQMQTTKQLLTEGQRIAYVGVVRLSLAQMLKEIECLERTRGAKKAIEFAEESLKMWTQKMMIRLYAHMELDSQEQIMVEQLAEHGVVPSDMTPTLMANARVKNPQHEKAESETASVPSLRNSMNASRPQSQGGATASGEAIASPATRSSTPGTPRLTQSRFSTPTEDFDPPPAYEEASADNLTVQAELGHGKDIDLDIRWTVLCDLFLLLIADSTYDARSRRLLELVGDGLSVDWREICRFEKRVTDALEMQEQAEKETWNEQEHLESRRKKALRKRLMFMGLCTVGGGLVIGLSAGLLAPVIGGGLAAGFATIGVSGTSTFLGGAGGAAIIGTTGALTGGTIGVRAGSRRTGAVKTFEYRPLHNNKRVNLIVTVSGWMTGKVDDVRLPFSTIDPIMGDIYSVHWEPEMLQSTGQTINILATEALTQTIQQILGSTVLTMLMAGLSLPIVLTKLSYLIDNPWSVSLARADSAGLILADSLIDRNLGLRPITLVGYSLGSRVIFSCLRELASRGAQGLVQNVFLFGTPLVSKTDEYLRARTVVSGRFVNGYATNDWILGYLFRATSGGIMRIAGLNTINVPGIENMDVTETVPGHMAYRGKMPVLLRQCGWLVESDEFSEIEDPDPDNHEARQRELISEIEAARLELEEKEKAGESEKKKGIRGWFSTNKKKAKQKKDWETYDPERVAASGEAARNPEQIAAANENVMFDVDAIRREALKLALEGTDIEEIKQHISVREIQSTMPVMRISSTPSTPQPSKEATVNGSWPGFPTTKHAPYVDETHNNRATSSAGRYWEREDEGAASLSFNDGNRPAVSMPEISSTKSVSKKQHLSPTLSPSSQRSSADLPTPPEMARSRSPHSFSERPWRKSPLASPTAEGTTKILAWPHVDRNCWEEDDEFGKEKEVSMTFD